jgi:kynurenine 3-monooxygenase
LGRLRKPEAEAISEMAVENFLEMRDKVAQPEFLFEKIVEKILQERFSGDYIPRYSLVTFSRVPYRQAQDAGVVQSRILSELCRGLRRPEDVDLKKAGELVRRELVPVMRRR